MNTVKSGAANDLALNACRILVALLFDLVVAQKQILLDLDPAHDLERVLLLI